MYKIFVFSVSFFLALSLFGVVWLRANTWNSEHESYVNQFSPTIFNITTSDKNANSCAASYNCICEETTQESCKNKIVNKEIGECGHGYHCCKSKCETCYSTCYRTCCDKCDYQDCVTAYNDGKPSEICITKQRDCNCHDCDPYQCEPHNCDCVCVSSVQDIKCEAYIYDCVPSDFTKPTYVITYYPLDNQLKDDYQECYDRSIGLGLSNTISDKNCHHYLNHQITHTTSCDKNDETCVDTFLQDYPKYTTFNGLYNRNNLNEIHLDNKLDFSPSTSLVNGLIVTSIGVGIFSIVLIAVLFILKRKYKKKDYTSTAISEVEVTNMP
jgi:hypothetical protein